MSRSEFALIPAWRASSNNKTIRNVITPRHQEQEPWISRGGGTLPKGQHYTMFHILLLSRDPQITSICSYSVKKHNSLTEMTNNLGIRSDFQRDHPQLLCLFAHNPKVTLISLLAASMFAEHMGFTAEDLTTNKSINIFSQWLKGNCQPNYRKVRIPEWVCLCVRGARRLIVSRGNDENTNAAGETQSFTLLISIFFLG